MNASNAEPSGQTRGYTPFWALCLVFLPLIFLQIMYLVEDYREREQILKQREQYQTAGTQLNGPLARAQTIGQTTDAIGRELLTLSSNSPEAASIISEFRIQLNRPPLPPK